MRFARSAAAITVAGLLAACGSGGGGTTISSAADAARALQQYCSDCHNAAEYAGGMSLHRLDAAAVQAHPETWELIVARLRTGSMPPRDVPRPEPATYESLAGFLEHELDRTAEVYPGPPALRRLNRAEYANAVRDLLDLEVDAATLLPPDDSAFGFDNIGDLLVFSPALLERYLTAADRVSALAVGDREAVAGSETYRVRRDQSQANHLEGLPLGTVGGLAVEHYFPLDAKYEFAVTLTKDNLENIRGLEHMHQLEIAVDGERIFLADVGGAAEEGRPGTTITERSEATEARLRVTAPVRAGPRRVTAAFIHKMGHGTNRLRPFEYSNAGTYDSTGRPHVDTLTILGPMEGDGPGKTPSRERIFSCTPSDAGEEIACAREILGTLARRAYRRPITDTDLDVLLSFYSEGRAKGDFETGIQLALRRILASPSFLLRVEEDATDVPAGEPYPVSDIELASRLSFFLWSSIPDDELLDVAERGLLSEPGMLEAQVKRMLADPKAYALAENFAGQWLHLRNLQNIRPNSATFPDFDNNLREAFRREAELFFASIVEEDRSILDLLTADYTFVNGRLARHYGIPNVYGSHFRRIELGPELSARRGLLGKGGILMATSHADRTAPSLRGKWILENLLGTPPPPPPPNVPAIDEGEPGTAPKTMRERLRMHAENPSCASCHQLIDPLGFALENFDAIGAWRTFELGRPVDATGTLMNGASVNGAADLRETLVQDPRLFAGTVTEKLLIYALGRGLQHYDKPVVRQILRRAEASDYRFSSIVLAIVESTPFRMRATLRDEQPTEL